MKHEADKYQGINKIAMAHNERMNILLSAFLAEYNTVSAVYIIKQPTTSFLWYQIRPLSSGLTRRDEDREI